MCELSAGEAATQYSEDEKQIHVVQKQIIEKQIVEVYPLSSSDVLFVIQLFGSLPLLRNFVFY